ncbi:MAG: S46 family peptidase [Bacteroidetes bacterium]|nr:S46 family peptidase [Bacteroidota bacterium]
MKKIYIIALALALIGKCTKADEGLWIPLFLGELNEAQMKALGMRITAEDIYSENNVSLKDAIVIFGRGCTAEVISDQGLILTNHHCAYGTIQSHSSIEHDYLTNGFWAMNKAEELSNPGLTVTFLIRMEEVTKRVLKGTDAEMTEQSRNDTIQVNIAKIKDEAVKDNHFKAEIKSFFCKNRYFLFVNEVFEDVRLVGAPPSNIGKFGGDTDNWMWPRHTGDFSLFRIYADSSNKPAKYSENNIPYKPKKHLHISAKKISEGDFTFVFGYPGSTDEYIPSYGIDMQVNFINPPGIELQGKKIDIYKKAMEENSEVRIQYAAKLAGIANGWKKAIGENRGITRLKTIEEKKAFEKIFADWAGSSDKRNKKYGGLLPEFGKVYQELSPAYSDLIYLRESVLGIEIFRFARSFDDLIRLCKDNKTNAASIKESVENLKKSSENFYKNYQVSVDQEVFRTLMPEIVSDQRVNQAPPIIKKLFNDSGSDINNMCDKIFGQSVFASRDQLLGLLDNFKQSRYKKIEKDIAFRVAAATSIFASEYYLPVINAKRAVLDSLMRVYMQAQMEMQPFKNFYPDANFTLRVTYGNVMGYKPSDAVSYNYFTTLEGILEKEDPAIYDYVVEDRLKELYRSKDYGDYADPDGTMHVCFIGTNHTSGGNSGSPVLDADGNLIGLNFDRCWEGTMSDLDYDITQCRNIGLDIRYCLFIIDKFAGAGHLVDEMTIVTD